MAVKNGIADDAADIRASAAPGQMRCAGAWTLRGTASLENRIEALHWPAERDVTIDCSAVSAMDTSGAWLLHRTIHGAEARQHRVELSGLRAEFDALLKLIASRATEVDVPAPQPLSALAKFGEKRWRGLLEIAGMVGFLGEAAAALAQALARPSRIRWKPVLHNLQIGGFEALPITGLLSFLLGIVIAYQGAEQLRLFGANIYVVDLVGLSMVRELSPLITAIIVAGRSGSAYTAQIGTMKVTEEIDALRTIGIGPLDLLVLPKTLALMIALPLLTVYTDIMGILGGMVMARAQLDVSYGTFLDRLQDALTLNSYLIGIGKAPIFAAIIALVGCYQGFRATGSADSVGRQTTTSVVQAIFLVIVTDAFFSIVFSWLEL